MTNLRPIAASGPERAVAISATRTQRSVAAAAKPAATPRRATTADATPRRAQPAPSPEGPRARRFASAALQSAKRPTALELSRLVGAKMRDVDGRQLGKVSSVLIEGELAEGWVVIEEGGRGGSRYFLPAGCVEGGKGGAWTSLQRAQVIGTVGLVGKGGLSRTSERLLKAHYASAISDRSRYSELLARERLVRRSRPARVVNPSRRLS